MLRLNLLPPQQRQTVERVKTLTLLQELLIIIFVFMLLASGAALYARLTLEQKFAQTILESTPGSRKIAELNREIEQVNQRLGKLKNAYSGVELWSTLLFTLGQYVPPAVALQSVQVLPDGALTMAGRASSREELLAMRDLLSQQALFSSVEVPLKYLVQERDFDFVLNAKLNSQALQILP